MNTTVNAYRAGLRRGVIGARITLTTPSDMLSFLMPIIIALTVLFFLRESRYEDAVVSLGTISTASLVGMNVVFGGVAGIAGVLVMDRTNGTLLRAKAIPGGMTGYLVGEILATALFICGIAFAIVGFGVAVFDGLQFSTPDRWLLFVAVLFMGLAATLPVGALLGALITNPKNMSLVMLPLMGLTAISGIFYPLAAASQWVQYIAQVFPMYWLGLGTRRALLPDEMGAYEIDGSWRTPLMFGVLGLWAVASMALAPRLLRRMARRESGSAVAERRRQLEQQLG